MSTFTRIGAALAVSLVALTVTSTAPATASGTFAVTAPADVGGSDAVWYSGETKTITWTVDAETGSYTLELWSTGGSAAKLATIATGTDITAGTYRWTIPTAMAPLIAEDVVVNVVPSSGAVATSDQFDLRRSTISDINLCDSVPEWPLWWTFCLNAWSLYDARPGEPQFVYWSTAGPTGGLVKIELVQTAGSVTTTTVLAKSVPNDGQEKVVLPSKLTADTGFDESYKMRVTPLLTGTTGRDSGTFPVYGSSAVSINVGMGPSDVTVAEGENVEIQWSGPGQSPLKIEAKPATGKPILVYSGTRPGPDFRWRPRTTGTYELVVSDIKNKKVTATATNKVIVTANADVVRQAAPSDTTATIGQPITLSWAFFDDNADTDANAVRLPVDINLVNSAGKVTNIAKAYAGVWLATAPAGHVGPFMPGFVEDLVWRPSGKLAAGAYTIKVNRTGQTATSDQAITLAQPATLTTTDFTSATFEVGERVTVDWTVTDDAEVPVDITLVPTGEGKAVSLAKKLVAPGATTDVVIPVTTAPGTYQLTVSTVDKFGTTPAVLTSAEAVTITAASLTVTAPATIKNGQQITVEWDYADDSGLPVKLELFQGAGTKAVKTIAKSAPTASPGEGSYTWTIPGDLPAATDYVVKATVIGPKSAGSDLSEAMAVTAPSLTVDEDPFTGGVTIGQTVAVEWASDSGVAQAVTVSLVKGTKVVAKLDAKEVTVNGAGTFAWLAGSKLAPGTDYKIRLTDNAFPTLTDDSAAFTISTNPTTAAS